MARPVDMTRAEFDRINRGRAAPGSPLLQVSLPKGEGRVRGNPEHDGQAEYFLTGVPRLKEQHPASAHLFDLTYANPNWMGAGKSTFRVAQMLKAEGKKAGIPDLFHPVARFAYHGLYVENKIGTERMSDDQLDWALRFQRQSYAVVVCRGETPAELALSIELVIGRYTMFDVLWHDHIPKPEKWL